MPRRSAVHWPRTSVTRPWTTVAAVTIAGTTAAPPSRRTAGRQQAEQAGQDSDTHVLSLSNARRHQIDTAAAAPTGAGTAKRRPHAGKRPRHLVAGDAIVQQRAVPRPPRLGRAGLLDQLRDHPAAGDEVDHGVGVDIGRAACPASRSWGQLEEHRDHRPAVDGRLHGGRAQAVSTTSLTLSTSSQRPSTIVARSARRTARRSGAEPGNHELQIGRSAAGGRGPRPGRAPAVPAVDTAAGQQRHDRARRVEPELRRSRSGGAPGAVISSRGCPTKRTSTPACW